MPEGAAGKETLNRRGPGVWLPEQDGDGDNEEEPGIKGEHSWLSVHSDK